MNYLQDPKDPAEVITVSFDYAAISDTISNPAVSISVRWGYGTHSTPLAANGSPVIDGSKVLQRFTGGTHMYDYELKCLAYTPSGDRLSVDCVLAVRTRPV